MTPNQSPSSSGKGILGPPLGKEAGAQQLEQGALELSHRVVQSQQKAFSVPTKAPEITWLFIKMDVPPKSCLLSANTSSGREEREVICRAK